MSKIDDPTRLRHMLLAAREACDMAATETRASLDSDRKLSLALVRLIEIVGEAAAYVSKDKQSQLQEGTDQLRRDILKSSGGKDFKHRNGSLKISHRNS